MITKTKILVSILALIFVSSCNYDESIPPTERTAAASKSQNDPTGMAQCPDCNPTTQCWQTETIHGQEVTFSIPCGTDDGAPGLPPPPFTSPATPAIYCAPAGFPSAPTNGKMYKVGFTGSSCSSPIYYYSCTAGAWVVPVNAVYGHPPTTNLYSGLHYASNYNGTGITYVYLKSFAGQSDSWYFVVSEVSSQGCGIM